jgi:hypothetical protein
VSLPGRRALSKAIEDGKAHSTLTVLAIVPRYSGKSAAAVVSATERYAERLAYDVRWLEEMPFTAVARRAKQAQSALEKAKTKDVVLLAEITNVGKPGMNTLAAEIGIYPLCVAVTGEESVLDNDPMHLSLTDLVGALQAATLKERLTIPEELPLADTLLSGIRGIEFLDGKFVGVDSAALRAVALGLWYCGHALGDLYSEPEVITNELDDALHQAEEEREHARDMLGTLDPLD